MEPLTPGIIIVADATIPTAKSFITSITDILIVATFSSPPINCITIISAKNAIKAIIHTGEENVATIKMSVIEVIKLFAVGIVASATMIIPGVSGSMMLMILGYYAPILESINDFIRCLTKVDVAGMLDAAKILFPFGIGVLVGIVLIAKLVEYLFNHFEKETFYGILGLLAASPIAILMNTGIDNVGAVTVIASLVCLVAGYGIARVLTKLDSE